MEYITDNRFALFAPYNKKLIDEFRALDGAQWDAEKKCWTFLSTPENLIRLDYLQGNIPPEHVQYYAPIPAAHHSDRPLFGYQKEAIDFILYRKGCLLAYEMGLGKTLVGIEVMEALPYLQWWLVAPKGAQATWEWEFRKWGARVRPAVIETYESLYKWAEWTPDGIIFDESIKLKNSDAQRSRAARACVNRMRKNDPTSRVILFSGAPAPKTPTDWWHQVELSCPGWLREGSSARFTKRYANIEYRDDGYGLHPTITGWKQDELVRLGERLKPVVLVKHVKDCLDLPEKIFDRIQCTHTDDFKKAAILVASQCGTGIEALNKLRQLSDGFSYETGERLPFLDNPKLQVLTSLLEQYSEDNTDRPGRLVIYAAYREAIEMIKEFLEENKWRAYTLDGRGWSDPKFLDYWNDTRLQGNMALVAYPGCVHGLNLQLTRALIYFSNSFQPDDRIQSLARRDRAGCDFSQGTRIVDIINLSTDEFVLDKVNEGLSLQTITLDEIRRYL